MQALINDLDHPESVNISILDKLDSNSGGSAFFHSEAVKGIGIALSILTAFALLAFLLQTLHH
jgi:hypothetical protein